MLMDLDLVFSHWQGFAIGSASLVSLALFGAFVSRAGIATVNVIEPEVSRAPHMLDLVPSP